MNIKNLFAFAALAAAGTAQGAVIYSEDFTGQDGKGAIGAATDLTGVDWAIDLGAAALFNDNDKLVVEGDRLVANDTNAQCIDSSCTGTAGDPIVTDTLARWLSPVLDISGFTNLALSLDADGSGTFEVGGGVNSEDDFIVEIILDGVTSIVADLITANGAFPTQTVSSMIADGSTLQVAVAMNTYAASELLFLDNVQIQGDAIPAPIPGTLLLIALGGLALRRRW